MVPYKLAWLQVPGFCPGKNVPESILLSYVGKQNVLKATVESVLKRTLPHAMASVCAVYSTCISIKNFGILVRYPGIGCLFDPVNRVGSWEFSSLLNRTHNMASATFGKLETSFQHFNLKLKT